jgi:hypothetical protein
MKGFRTVAIGLAIAIGPAAITYLLGLDWTSLIGPNAALFVVGLLQIGMRMITTTPVGKANP